MIYDDYKRQRKRRKEQCLEPEKNLYFSQPSQPGARPIFIIFANQTFTVIWQVAFTSILGVYHGYGFTANFIPDYLMTYCRNFIMAFPLQLIFVGPLARLIFKTIFIKPEKVKSSTEIQNEDEEILEEAM